MRNKNFAKHPGCQNDILKRLKLQIIGIEKGGETQVKYTENICQKS